METKNKVSFFILLIIITNCIGFVNCLSAVPLPCIRPETESFSKHDIISEKSGSGVIRKLPFVAGEKLVYRVEYKGLKIGTSTLTFEGARDIEDEPVYLINFFTDTLYLKDRENIFAEKDNFLPVKVERTIKRTPGFTTVITEHYNQDEYTIDIVKQGFMGKKEMTIDKSSSIHNAILISYYFRLIDNLKDIQDFLVNLPTKKFFLSYDGIEKIRTGIGDVLGFKFEGQPYSFNFWLSLDKERVPLKIEDPGMFGYSLILERKDSVETEN